MISAFVASYGYLAVFLGTLIEGETVLFAAGYAAHRGLLAWPVVLVVAFAGAILGDQLAFVLGRWKGEQLLSRFPALARGRPKVCELLERYAALFILTNRFLYGLRIAGPVLLGMSHVARLRFALLNALGAVLWAIVVSGAGYAFGFAMNALIADMKLVEESVFVAIMALGALLWLWYHLRNRAWDRKKENQLHQ
jgi:membrane protein DedA with SNARE-associated domain